MAGTECGGIWPGLRHWSGGLGKGQLDESRGTGRCRPSQGTRDEREWGRFQLLNEIHRGGTARCEGRKERSEPGGAGPHHTAAWQDVS